MAEGKRVGRWGRLGRTQDEISRIGYLSFEQEAERAALLTSKAHEDSQGHMNIMYATLLPGWQAPLFAHGGGYIFLRRPEGVWKMRCTSAQNQHTTVYLSSIDRKLLTPFNVGTPAHESGCWHRHPGEPVSPEQIDAWHFCPDCLETEDLGGILLNPPTIEGRSVIFDVGDAFASRPKLRYDGGRWIIGVGHDGSKLAFDASGIPWIQNAVVDGVLFLRFTSRLFDSFDVLVENS